MSSFGMNRTPSKTSLSLSLSNGDFVIITELLTGLVLFLLLLLHCVYTVVN